VKKRVIIMGAAGRDFHNFNTYYRNNPEREVVAFTATQIPDIAGRKYPPELAGEKYPQGIPIYDETELSRLIGELKVDEVTFSYSDVNYDYLMHRASLVNACGANFLLLGSKLTMLKSANPVVAVCAVRTGCGKSQTTRRVADILQKNNKKVGVVRHPMPYGDLKKQIVQRFASLEDLDKHKCTIEEREEYEPHIMRGILVYAGVDYELILREIEKEVDIVVWDGGNNDIPFYQPDLHIVIADSLRVGHELRYYPGETNLRMADCVVINKIDSAKPQDVERLVANIRSVNERADIVKAESPVTVENPDLIKGKRVLVVEDGPTLTHGEMEIGAGFVAAERYGAQEIVDPHPYLVGKIADTFKKYPNIGNILPAMGYSEEQIGDLAKTIENTPVDSVVIGTPIDLNRLFHIKKPSTRVFYELAEIGSPNLNDILKKHGII
jgi:predicted GTPase